MIIYLTLFLTFLKIGAVAFGGGYAMISLVKEEVLQNAWLTESEFINFIDYNRHRMNIKGSSCMNDYKLIIITSVQKLNEIYSNCNGEPRKQWERRVERIILPSVVLKNEDTEIPLEALI